LDNDHDQCCAIEDGQAYVDVLCRAGAEVRVGQTEERTEECQVELPKSRLPDRQREDTNNRPKSGMIAWTIIHIIY